MIMNYNHSNRKNKETQEEHFSFNCSKLQNTTEYYSSLGWKAPDYLDIDRFNHLLCQECGAIVTQFFWDSRVSVDYCPECIEMTGHPMDGIPSEYLSYVFNRIRNRFELEFRNVDLLHPSINWDTAWVDTSTDGGMA